MPKAYSGPSLALLKLAAPTSAYTFSCQYVLRSERIWPSFGAKSAVFLHLNSSMQETEALNADLSLG